MVLVLIRQIINMCSYLIGADLHRGLPSLKGLLRRMAGGSGSRARSIRAVHFTSRFRRGLLHRIINRLLHLPFASPTNALSSSSAALMTRATLKNANLPQYAGFDQSRLNTRQAIHKATGRFSAAHIAT